MRGGVRRGRGVLCMASRSYYSVTSRYRQRGGRPVRLFVINLGYLVLLASLGFAWIFYQDLTRALPEVEHLAEYASPAATRVYVADGSLLGEFYQEKRYPVSLEQIPAFVQQAFIVAEDANFYQHFGIDVTAIGRALLANWRAGRTVQGGSTITQQVVKSLLLTPERSYRRKIQEIILSIRLERHASKAEILALYLNQIYLGSGAYGVETAAREYFGKSVTDLSLAEATLLAGLPPAPSRYSPRRHFERAKFRQRYVLERMLDEHIVSYTQAMDAWKESFSFRNPRPAVSFARAPHFMMRVRQFLGDRYGREVSPQLGLNVHTTLDPVWQRAGERAIRNGIHALCEQTGCGQGDIPWPEGALISIDLTSGHIKAMVGSYDFRRSQFNHATQARRQPGSAFKPLVYAAALDRNYTPASIIVDSRVSYQDRKQSWTPQNYERRYFGPTRLRKALTLSRNVVTVKMAAALGMDYLTTYISQLGIQSPLTRNLSLALGTSEVTLLELARAYGVFATGGFLLEPSVVSRITDGQGNSLDELTPQRKQVISAETAYLMTSMLQSVVEAGTGRRVKSLGRSVAGKTGTSDDFHDAWFIGYTPDILTGVWIGFDRRRSLGDRQTGGRVAAPIWLEFMHAATQDLPMRDFEIPEGIAIMHIDPRTGLRARPGRPSILECFRRGTEPTVFAKARRRAVKKKKVVAKAPVYADPVLFPGLLAARSSEDGF